MNRINAYYPKSQTPAVRPTTADKRLRRDAEAMLRDIAFVLKMTQRVKSEILASRAVTV